jgi:hypothetical protein
MPNSSPLFDDQAQQTPAFPAQTELNNAEMTLARPLPI